MLPVPLAAELPAIAGLLHENVTPEDGVADGVQEKVDPPQMCARVNGLVNTGTALTLTVAWVVLVHPLASDPVTVQVVVTDGLALTLAVFTADKPSGGLHA